MIVGGVGERLLLIGCKRVHCAGGSHLGWRHPHPKLGLRLRLLAHLLVLRAEAGSKEVLNLLTERKKNISTGQ